MAITYEISSTDDLMVVATSGSDENLEEVQHYGLAIIENAKRLGCAKILCNELNLEYRLNTMDTFQSATFIAEHAPRVANVAIVCNPKFITDARFWETVAINRGLMVRVFADLAEAAEWLEAL